MASLDNRTTVPRPREDAESDTETPIVWPDPSPLDSWWEQVMGPDARPARRSVA
ncbi:hypothetical protein [Nocardia sp. NPDC048505]|uniref:hypothetical protein n=1 Tax=unclassified Nocardia TaxID=2637762 RepID=UPI0033FFC90D